MFRFRAPSVPDVEGLSNSQAALAYAKAGWFVLPVQPGQNHPGSVVGNGRPQQSSRDPEQIAAWWAQNPDYGIALHAGRSGAVVFDLDKASLSELPAEMADGLRQGVCQLSRRDDPDRGHYLFLNDSDHGNGAGAFAPFGEVRGRSGVIIVAPTPHAKDGGEYRWRRTGELPALPEALRRCLSAASSKEVPALTDAELQVFLTDPAHSLSERPGRLTGPRNWFVDQVVGGASVHTSILEALCWAFRESVGGAYPAVDALGALQEDFHNAFGSDARGAGDRQSPAPNEFYNAAAWAAAQVKDADPEQIRQRMDRDDPAKAEVDEDAFWTARPELAQLRDFVRSRRVGPWSMFGAVLARAVAVIPPSVVLPDLRGSYGSLNLFVALVAPSGKGKGTSEAASEDAVQTDPEVHSATPGSGEGILKEYAFKRKSEQVDVRNSVLFTVSEIDSLAALKSRSGSTLMPELRKAWMGEQLGFGYAADDKKFAIKRHRYRMTMVVGVQPGRSVTLFEDADGGTPQRFLFYKGERYTVPHDWSQPIAMGTFYYTILKPALEAAGLPVSRPATADQPAQQGVRLHDLRHTFATMQLMAGVHFMQVSKWLGHSTFVLPLDTYGDWIPEEDGGALNDLPEPTPQRRKAPLRSNRSRRMWCSCSGVEL